VTTRRAYAATTEASSEKTRNDIMRLLTLKGATKSGYSTEPGFDTIAFELEERRVKLVLPLPTRQDRRVVYTDKERYIRTPREQIKAYEQLIRSRWRALYLVVKAKIEAVELGISTFEDEFLANTVLPNQQTVAEYLKPQIERVYMTGQMPTGVTALAAGKEESPAVEATDAEYVEV
jgi:hypothetical protein